MQYIFCNMQWVCLLSFCLMCILHHFLNKWTLLICCNTFTWLWLAKKSGLITGLTGHLNVCNCNEVQQSHELHAPKITVTTAHVKASNSSIAVAPCWLPMTDILLCPSFRTPPGLSHHLLTSSYNYSSHLTHPATQKSQANLCYDRWSPRQIVLVLSFIWVPKTRFLFLDGCEFPSRTRGQVCSCCLLLKPVSGPSAVGLVTMFYCLRFMTTPNWMTRSSYFELLSLVYRPGMDHMENVSSIIVCSLTAEEMACSQGRSLATAVVLLSVYSAAAWQWVCVSQYIVSYSVSAHNGIQLWDTASISNIEILECFWSVALHMIVYLPRPQGIRRADHATPPSSKVGTKFRQQVAVA
jgi:hypothetical protein